MTTKLKKFLFIGITVLLAVIFVLLTLKNINTESIKKAVQEADYTWFAISMLLCVFTYWLRAARWNLLLKPMGHPIAVKSGFWAVAFGYFLNLTIPRSGEIARATTLYTMENVPVDKSIGTIVLERVIDLCFLSLFFLLTFIFNSKTLFSFIQIGLKERENVGQEADYTRHIVFLGVCIFLAILFFAMRKKIVKSNFYRKVVNFIKGIFEGFKSILKLEKRFLFFVYSTAIWICYFFMTYLLVFAFPATSDFGIGEGFFLIVSGSLGMILPVTGGLAYPYVMSIAFVAIYLAMGQSPEEGREVGNYFGLMSYIGQIIIMLVLGLGSIIYISKVKKKRILKAAG